MLIYNCASREDALKWVNDGVLTIPEGITSLDPDFAFFVVREDLPKVSELIIPATVINIKTMRGDYSCGPYGYRNNPFSKIVVSDENPFYKSVDGVLFSKDGKELISYPCGKKGDIYHVPDGVEVIETEAFLNVEHLRKIHFPKTLQKINKNAFTGCAELDFPDIIEIFSYRDSYIIRIDVSILEGSSASNSICYLYEEKDGNGVLRRFDSSGDCDISNLARADEKQRQKIIKFFFEREYMQFNNIDDADDIDDLFDLWEELGIFIHTLFNN